jgi:hypothetical protein
VTLDEQIQRQQEVVDRCHQELETHRDKEFAHIEYTLQTLKLARLIRKKARILEEIAGEIEVAKTLGEFEE